MITRPKMNLTLVRVSFGIKLGFLQYLYTNGASLYCSFDGLRVQDLYGHMNFVSHPKPPQKNCGEYF